MDKSENLKDFEAIYRLVCKTLKKQGISAIPVKEEFYTFYIKCCQLIEEHKNILTAIGKL